MSTGQGIIGNNMFVYCQNNPIIYKDDSGNFVVLTICIATVVGGLVGMGFGALSAQMSGTDVGVGALTGGLTGAICGGLGAVGGIIGTGFAVTATSLSAGAASAGVDYLGQRLNYNIDFECGEITVPFEPDVGSMIHAGVGGTLSTAIGAGIGMGISPNGSLGEVVVGGTLTGYESGLLTGCLDLGIRGLETSWNSPPAQMDVTSLLRKNRYTGIYGFSNFFGDVVGLNRPRLRW